MATFTIDFLDPAATAIPTEDRLAARDHLEHGEHASEGSAAAEATAFLLLEGHAALDGVHYEVVRFGEEGPVG